jgi:hypothetical protein
MKLISLAKLHAAAAGRKPGYIEAVMAVSQPVSGTHIKIPTEDFDRIRRDYSIKNPLP